MLSNKDDDIFKQGEKLIFNPYNNLNNEVTVQDVQSILNRYGVPGKVNNLALYKRAFDHRSYTKRPELENEKNNIIITEQPPDCLPLRSKSNERLEFLGDGVLELIVKFYLYRRFPKNNEGFMTEKKIALVKNESIGKIAYEMRLHKWYIISKHAEEKGIRSNLKKLGCLFEAFLGALFLDFNKTEVFDENALFSNFFVTGPGFQYAQIFVENILEKHVDWNILIDTDDNFKNILQVKIQKEFKVTPNYLETVEYDPENGYSMGVYICLGQQIHEVNIEDAIPFRELGHFERIHDVASQNDGKAFIFLAKSLHKIKKKAEQNACAKSIELIE